MNAGHFTDRALGAYRLQFTTVPSPDATTADTGDASTGWQDVGTVNYIACRAALFFTPYLRHRFRYLRRWFAGRMRPAFASRFPAARWTSTKSRLTVPPVPRRLRLPLVITPAAGYSITWDGNDGQFNDPDAGAAPPANRALASAGTIPFTSSDLGPCLTSPYHRAVNLNDGLYGNAP